MDEHYVRFCAKENQKEIEAKIMPSFMPDSEPAKELAKHMERVSRIARLEQTPEDLIFKWDAKHSAAKKEIFEKTKSLPAGEIEKERDRLYRAWLQENPKPSKLIEIEKSMEKSNKDFDISGNSPEERRKAAAYWMSQKWEHVDFEKVSEEIEKARKIDSQRYPTGTPVTEQTGY